MSAPPATTMAAALRRKASPRAVASADAKFGATAIPGAPKFSSRLITIVVRPASGLPIEAKVLRPSTTGLPMVSVRKCAMSDFSRHGSALPRPMTPFSATAAIMIMSNFQAKRLLLRLACGHGARAARPEARKDVLKHLALVGASLDRHPTGGLADLGRLVRAGLTEAAQRLFCFVRFLCEGRRRQERDRNRRSGDRDNRLSDRVHGLFTPLAKA